MPVCLPAVTLTVYQIRQIQQESHLSKLHVPRRYTNSIRQQTEGHPENFVLRSFTRVKLCEGTRLHKSYTVAGAVLNFKPNSDLSAGISEENIEV